MSDNSLVSTDADKSRRNLTTLVYALYAASWLIGVTGLVAIIINYLKRGDMEGTIYESHFTWQIRTFWLSVGVAVLGLLLTIVGIGVVILLADGVWCIYRLVKGWLALNDGKAIADPKAWF